MEDCLLLITTYSSPFLPTVGSFALVKTFSIYKRDLALKVFIYDHAVMLFKTTLPQQP